MQPGASLSVLWLQLQGQLLSCCFLKQRLLQKHFCSQPIACDLKANLPSLIIKGPNSKGNYYRDLRTHFHNRRPVCHFGPNESFKWLQEWKCVHVIVCGACGETFPAHTFPPYIFRCTPLPLSFPHQFSHSSLLDNLTWGVGVGVMTSVPQAKLLVWAHRQLRPSSADGTRLLTLT